MGLKAYHLWGRITLLQAVKQELGGFLPYLVGRLANCGQAGMRDGCPLEIIKANERYVLWAAQSHPIYGLQSTDGHQAVRHEKRSGPLPGQGRLLLSTHLDREGFIPLSEVRLRGNEGLLLEVQAPSLPG